MTIMFNKKRNNKIDSFNNYGSSIAVGSAPPTPPTPPLEITIAI